MEVSEWSPAEGWEAGLLLHTPPASPVAVARGTGNPHISSPLSCEPELAPLAQREPEAEKCPRQLQGTPSSAPSGHAHQVCLTKVSSLSAPPSNVPAAPRPHANSRPPPTCPRNVWGGPKICIWTKGPRYLGCACPSWRAMVSGALPGRDVRRPGFLCGPARALRAGVLGMWACEASPA